MRWIVLVAVLLATRAAAASPVESLWPSIPRVVLPGSWGSGFAVTERHIVTNHHVIAEALPKKPGAPQLQIRVEIPGHGGPPALAVVKAVNVDADLAVLEVQGVRLQPLLLDLKLPAQAQEVISMGYPGTAVLQPGAPQTPSFTKGEVARLATGGSGPALIGHMAHVAGGNSGGPLLDTCHRVIGVNTAVKTDLRAVQGPGGADIVSAGTPMSWATSVQASFDLLRSLGESPLISDRPCTGAVSSPWQLPAAVFLSVAAVLLTLRRPRERIVRVVEQASRKVTDTVSSMVRATRQPPVDREALFVLSGFATPSGKALRVPVVLPNPSDVPTGAVREFVIGRSAVVAHATVDDPSISRRHVRIYMNEQTQPVVEDLNSVSGSRLNGSALRPFCPTPLNAGDKLLLGEIALTVVTGGRSSQSAG